VRYGVAGDGPPLVLVHGTPWSSVSWHRIIAALTPHFRVYYYDLLGYGQSEMRTGQTVSLDIQSEIFTALLRHWKLDAPAVIAHDFGGAITLRSHLLHGHDYAHYILMNVVALSPWGSPFFAHVKDHKAAFAGTPSYIHKAIVETYIKGALHTDLRDDDFERLVEPWLSETGQAAFYRQIAQADQRYTDAFADQLNSVRCDTLILWGEDDPWIPIDTGRRLHAAMPGSQFQSIPKAGHLVQLEAPEKVSAAVINFLLR